MIWVFAVKPVLIIDAKATEHILHRHGIGKMKHIDVAHLWPQDEVQSNRLGVRRFKSETILRTSGRKRSAIKSPENMRQSEGYIDAQGNLKSEATGLWVGK